MDTPVSEFPGYFLKSPGALCGPYDSILLRPGMDCVDAEVELAVVIGGARAMCKRPTPGRMWAD